MHMRIDQARHEQAAMTVDLVHLAALFTYCLARTILKLTAGAAQGLLPDILDARHDAAILAPSKPQDVHVGEMELNHLAPARRCAARTPPGGQPKRRRGEHAGAVPRRRRSPSAPPQRSVAPPAWVLAHARPACAVRCARGSLQVEPTESGEQHTAGTWRLQGDAAHPSVRPVRAV